LLAGDGSGFAVFDGHFRVFVFERLVIMDYDKWYNKRSTYCQFYWANLFCGGALTGHKMQTILFLCSDKGATRSRKGPCPPCFFYLHFNLLSACACGHGAFLERGFLCLLHSYLLVFRSYSLPDLEKDRLTLWVGCLCVRQDRDAIGDVGVSGSDGGWASDHD